MAGTTLTELRDRRNEIVEIARARGASRVRVFGSVARGEAADGSDIDFLVDLEPGRSLLDLGGLLMDLQDLLERNVDVVTERGLRPEGRPTGARRRRRAVRATATASST